MSHDETLDREGEWEIRATIYRNGRRVGTCDTAGWDTYDTAAYWVSEAIGAYVPTMADAIDGLRARAAELDPEEGESDA